MNSTLTWASGTPSSLTAPSTCSFSTAPFLPQPAPSSRENKTSRVIVRAGEFVMGERGSPDATAHGQDRGGRRPSRRPPRSATGSKLTGVDDLAAGASREVLQDDQVRRVGQEADGAVGEGEVGTAAVEAAVGGE